MGQQEIWDLLKSQPTRWFTNKTIARMLGYMETAVARATGKMRDKEEIDYRLKENKHTWEYKWKEN